MIKKPNDFREWWHIKDCLPPFFDLHQFVRRANRSSADAISTTLTALTHLELHESHIRMLFVDFSLALNTFLSFWTNCPRLPSHHVCLD